MNWILAMVDDPLNLSPLPVEDWDRSLDGVVADMGGAPINVHKLMANNPDLLKAWWNFRNYSTAGGSLGNRLGELVILRVGIQMAAWYEWGSHVDRSLRCGLTLEEIDAVSSREIGPQWADKEAALLKSVDDLVETKCISPNTLSLLSRNFDSSQILDIIAIHGMYMILGCMINTWKLELDSAVENRISSHSSAERFEEMAETFHLKLGSEL